MIYSVPFDDSLVATAQLMATAEGKSVEALIGAIAAEKVSREVKNNIARILEAKTPAELSTITMAAQATGQNTITTPNGNVIKKSNLAYSSQGSVRKVDYYYLNDGLQSTRPIVIYIHGAAWGTGGGGDKDEAPRLISKVALAQLGFVVYAPNYTHAINGVWPAEIADLKTLLGWLAAGNGVGDVTKIALWGHSTGAHLALMLAMTPKSLFASSEYLSQAYTITCCAATSAPTNLTSLYANSTAGAYGSAQLPIQRLLGYVPSSNLPGAAAASPVTYVGAGNPPILLQSGSLDTLIPASQSGELETALLQAGASVQRVVFTGLDHDLDTLNPGGKSFAGVTGFLLEKGR